MKSLLTTLALLFTLTCAVPLQAESSEDQAKLWASMFSSLNKSSKRFIVVAYQQTTYNISNVTNIEASGRFLIITFRSTSSVEYKAIVEAENILVISEGP